MAQHRMVVNEEELDAAANQDDGEGGPLSCGEGVSGVPQTPPTGGRPGCAPAAKNTGKLRPTPDAQAQLAAKIRAIGPFLIPFVLPAPLSSGCRYP
jgi:hypothetical protein